MKKLTTLLLTLAFFVNAFAFLVFAGENTSLSADVYVSIVKQGTYVVTQEKISVTDADSDGKLTVNDALYFAHEAKYAGGAAAGYGYYTGTYGISLGKLWGDASGNFGYYLNNESAYELATPVRDGDRVCAFIYSDTVSYSDVYSFFEVGTDSVYVGSEVTFTLYALSFDANWNTVKLPLSNAKILVDGVDSGVLTDADGKASLTFTTEGKKIISAASDTLVLVPPAHVLDVAPALPDTNDSSVIFILTLSAISAAGMFFSIWIIRRSNKYANKK